MRRLSLIGWFVLCLAAGIPAAAQTAADSVVVGIDSTVVGDTPRYNIRSAQHNNFRKAELIVDSLKEAKVNLDSVSVDSLARTYFTDTLFVSRGIIPAYNIDGNAYATFRLDSLMREARRERMIFEKARAKEERKLNRTRLDTIPLIPSTLLSVVAPGFGQIYNRDYWKLPVLYGGVGGFVTGGVLFGKEAKAIKSRYEYYMKYDPNSDEAGRLNIDYMRYKNASTFMYIGAAVTYLYFICDGIWNYEYAQSRTQKATMLAIFLPGAGQIYNKAYWKLPILYGGAAVLGYIISFNGKGYVRFKKAYDALTDGDPNTVDEFRGQYDEEVLRNTRDNYRRYRDMAIFYTCGLYLLSIIDAYVDASLSRYDISDNLAVKVEPMCDFRNLRLAGGGGSDTPVAGLTLKLTF